MASSGSVFSETLQTITTTKLEVLAEQRMNFEKQYAALLDASSKEKDLVKRVGILAFGTKVCLGATANARLETDLKNLDRFLEQARYDPAVVSSKVVEDWESMLLQYLSVQSEKYQYADLYGKLVTEWLSATKEGRAPKDGDVEMGESFEEVPGAKRLQARSEWEKVVFVPKDIDKQALDNYLQALFNTNKDVAKAIEQLRKMTQQFESTLSSFKQFDIPTLKWVIEGLQRSDLLSNDKREVLKDFLSNDVILGESVNFKTQFQALRRSTWKSNSIEPPKEDHLRREYYLGSYHVSEAHSLDGSRKDKHRSSYFAHQLLDFEEQRIEFAEGEEEAEYDGNKGESRKRSRTLQMQMQQQLQQQAQQQQATGMKQHMMVQHMAMQSAPRARQTANQSGLPNYFSAQSLDNFDYDEFTTQAKQAKRPMQAKQDLLHMISTEIILNTRLHGESTSFRSVFELFNPLMPHDTILTVLKFFGVPDKWLTFFQTYLQAPLKFEDDESAAPRLRRRGMPGSHALSDVFGECILACLDFSVNQATAGGLLHRLFDDIWFWNKDYEKCAQAWDCVLQFTKATGIQINDAKTGSVRVARDKGIELTIDDRLPKGEIRWGFLYLDAATGRFEIDEAQVDQQIEELRKQLQGKSESIIGWISAWNTYAATFFSSNFGKPANCFGREHVNKMLATHRRIQERVFDGGNVVRYLRQQIESRFGVKNIPDGFLFFPVELGGLDLKSPFVGLLQIRESVEEDPYNLVEEFKEHELQQYADCKLSFERGNRRRDRNPGFHFVPPSEANVFFSFEEFARYREHYGPLGDHYGPACKADLGGLYRELLKRPVEKSIDLTKQVKQALEQLRGQSNLRSVHGDWSQMDAYWKWVAQMYGPDMVQRFGGLNVVDLGLLPFGMLDMLRMKRLGWQG